MKNFLFFTNEGYTFDPDDRDIENMQILGTGKGDNILEAFKNFKFEQSYLEDFTFKEVIAVEYVDDFIRGLEL